MQTRPTDRFRPVSTPQSVYINPRFLPEDTLRPAIVLGAMCLLLPPVGLVILWRSRRMTFHLRMALSAVAFISMTLIFFLLMRPAEIPSTIRPMPSTPTIAGYGSVSQNTVNVVIPSGTSNNVPAQPGAAPAPVVGSVSEPVNQTVGVLSGDSIVFAVTNNASSYHLYEICDFQENRRALTLAQALAEGLTPCTKCAVGVE